jgi:hypothetical protein
MRIPFPESDPATQVQKDQVYTDHQRVISLFHVVSSGSML